MNKIDVMEAFYYLDSEAKSDGKHLVHTFSCKMKEEPFPIKLGWQKNAQSALKKARRYYENVKLCDECTGSTFKNPDRGGYDKKTSEEINESI